MVGVRHSYVYIKTQFEKEGYKLLSETYVNNRKKLRCVCSIGHDYEVTYRDWYSGRRCNICANVNRRINQRNPSLNVKESFKKEGYTLLSEYINNRTKLKFRCPERHESKITWKSWLKNCRCQMCAGNARLTIGYVRKEFNKSGYALLTNVYINSKQLMEYKCTSGHFNKMSYDNWRSGSRCPDCYREKNCGSNHPGWKGGISCEPYCDAWADKEYKESIKERDEYKCQNPYCCCKQRRASVLTIHHIDYNKKNCMPNNLITLCRSCNGMANKDRQWHTDWYRIIMNKKYKYNY